MIRPDSAEYNPYFEKYISLVPGENIVETLSGQIEDSLTFLRGLSDVQGELRYAPGKWSVKEVIGHLIDVERIFAYRALRIARSDRTPLPGFDENEYVAHASFPSLNDLAAEYQAVRNSNLYFFRSLSEETWLRRGIASSNEISVRAIAYILAGHELHHLGIIRSRYLRAGEG
ncbi:MAG: DinB family protein [Blastocatellia bacterium]|nr:DinB family protein [Blastocatellia bacterium]